MVPEVTAVLDLKPGAVVVDATLGLGGHSLVLSGLIGSRGRLIGIDQDSCALEIAKERLKGVSCRLDIVKSNFLGIEQALDSVGAGQIDAVLFDLGVSSLQMDDPQRGFSFNADAPLDMRMDMHAALTAEAFLNAITEEELAVVIWKYGEERFSRRIARAIVQLRSAKGMRTTRDLVEAVERGLPKGLRREKIHPATRTFQAVRIAVNRELDVLEQAILKVFYRLRTGGRMALIAFHSLEDRIVKDKFRSLAQDGSARLLTRKPLRPGDDEVKVNPRSRSARLRALERTA
jgi:16S rRNA (cytosine1402-N4)-methyltransferase